MNGIIRSVVFQGAHYEINIETLNRTLLCHTIYFHNVGENVGLRFDPDDIQVMEKMEW
jgi:spermidine/putrescine transport system ATP-binding protein